MKHLKIQKPNLNLEQYLRIVHGLILDKSEIELITDLAIDGRAKYVSDKVILSEAKKLHDQESRGHCEKIREKSFIQGSKMIRNKFLNY